MPNVQYQKKELTDMLPIYTLIDDAIAGEAAVKAKRTKYLPMPSPEDQSTSNLARYSAYVSRAVFYNVARRTAAGLVGEVFDIPPAAKLPSTLDPIVTDASGGGISLEQLAKRLTRTALSKGRAGLFADFPVAPVGGFSRQQVFNGEARPNLTAYEPQDIINWRIQEVGGVDRLVLVVLKEEVVVSDDGFEEKKQTQYRALKLVDGQYRVEIYKSKFGTADSITVPTDAKGNPLDRIPFFFIGSENNDANIDEAPMYDLCSLNIAHYRNSADYEEACYIIGQPTPWFSGLTQTWVEEVLDGEILLGSRAAVLLPENGVAGLLQVNENSMNKEAMDAKEAQMVALGAKLVQIKDVAVTATEAKISNRSETSILATVAGNVTQAIEAALKVCTLFITGTADDTIEYKLNQQYALAAFATGELTELIAALQGNLISWNEARTRARYAGLATDDDKKAKDDIAADQAAADQRDVKKAGDLAKAVPPQPKPPAKA